MIGLLRLIVWFYVLAVLLAAWLLAAIIIPALFALCLLARDGWRAWRRYRAARRLLESVESLSGEARAVFRAPPGRMRRGFD